jgi:histidinol dehydrogenase
VTVSIDVIELATIDSDTTARILTRSAVPDENVRTQAAAIVQQVRDGGNAALISLNEKYGGGSSTGTLSVTEREIAGAFAQAGPELISALERAIDAIRAVHEQQRPTDQTLEPTPGVIVSRRWAPIRRVGVYVPGGGAVYPSSLLMGVIPAQVAGVDEIAVVCPAASTGAIDSSVLTAAHMLGITEVYATGGAQAVGALAYGTETIPRVDKIVGPGGMWVTAAKLAVFGTIGIDLPAGPSEAAVIVDASSDAAVAAADLLCQAEHGPDSVVALVTADREKADEVLAEIDRQLALLERQKVIREALQNHGLVVIAPDHPGALSFTNSWAPEHVSILTTSARADAEEVTAAGSVFVGRWTPESAGDYATGANHVLPTGGLAAAYGPLSTEDFGSWRQVQELTREGLENLAPTITTLANSEGLTAHAACVDVRLQSTPREASP